jgi:hypothetical protein
MVLQKATINIPFQKGLSENTSEYLSDPDTMFEFTNCRFNKLGEIVNAPMIRNVTFDGDVSDVVANRLITHNDSVYNISRGDYGYSDGIYKKVPSATFNSDWQHIGELPPYTVKREAALKDIGYDKKAADFCSTPYWDVYVYIGGLSPSVHYRFVNRFTGKVFEDTISGSSGCFKPKACAGTTGRVAITYAGGTLNDIFLAIYDCSGPDMPTVTYTATITGSLNSTYHDWDIIPWNDATYVGGWMIAYVTMTPSIVIKAISTTASTYFTNTFVTSVSSSGVALASWKESGTWLYRYMWLERTGGSEDSAYYRTFTTNLSLYGSTTSMGTIALRADTSPGKGQCVLAVDRSGVNYAAVGYRDVPDTAVKQGSSDWIWAARIIPVSRLWIDEEMNTYPRCYGYVQDLYSNTFYLVQIIPNSLHGSYYWGSPLKVITSLCYGEADWSSRTYNYILNVEAPSDIDDPGPSNLRRCILPTTMTVPVKDTSTATDKNVVISWDLITAERWNVEAHQTVSINNKLYISGGLLLEYDGNELYENGFIMDPWCGWRVSPPGATFGGVPASTAVMGAAVVYEWADRQGIVHRSQPSPAESVTGDGTTRYTLRVANLPLTWRAEKNSTCYISIFTTAYNGVRYLRQADYSTDRVVYGYKNGNSWGLDWTNDRDFPHGLLQTPPSEPPAYQEQIYSPPQANGELPNFPVYGGCTHIAHHNNRLWAASAERPSILFYSKEIQAAAPISFYPPGFQIELPGDIKGLASFNGVLIVFLEDSIYYINGEGPDFRGLAGTFSTPQLLTRMAGCTTWRSIIEYPDGLMFKSKSGLKIITKKLELMDIGTTVQDLVGADVSIVGAVHYEKDKAIIFNCDDFGDSHLAVYDYDNAAWYKWRYFLNTPAITVASDTVWLGGQYGALHYIADQDGVEFDSPIDIQATPQFSTGWISMEKINEYKRLYKVALRDIATNYHNIEIIVATSDGKSNSKIFKYSDLQAIQAGLGGNRVDYPVILNMTDQLSRAYKVTVSFPWEVSGQALPSGAVANPVFKVAGLSLEAGVKAGVRKR